MAKLTKTIAELTEAPSALVSFDRIGQSLSFDGNYPMGAKTVAKMSYLLAGVEDYAIRVSVDCNLKAMIKRAEKLGSLTGHFVAFYSEMTNQGYEYPYFLITMMEEI